MKNKFYIFLILIHFILGIVYIFLIPPFQSPDENTHYLRTKIIYNDSMQVQKWNNRLGSFVYKYHINFTSFTGRIAFGGLYLNSLPWNFFNNLEEGKQLEFTDFPNTALYSSFLYLPQSFSNLFDDFLSIYNSYIIGKIFIFVFFSSMLFFVTKSLRYNYRYIIYLFALLPVNLMISSSYNADILYNLASITVITIYLQDNSDRKTFGVLLLVVSLVIISWGKLSSLPLIIFAYIYIYKSFSKTYFIILGFLFLIICVSGVMHTYMHSKEFYIPYHEYNPDFVNGQPLLPRVHPDLQIEYLLSNPFNFLRIIFKSFEYDYDFIYRSSIGFMGWLDWEISKYSILFFLLLLLYFSFYGRYFKNRIFSKSLMMRFYVMLAVSILLTVTFMVLMYITWTPVGFGKVNNLQGRYFYASFLLLFLSVASLKFYIFPKRALQYASIFILLLQSFTLLQIYERYYHIQ